MPYDIIIGRDEADKKRFGKKGLVFLGKGYVRMGNYTSLSNRIWLDVARSHVVLIAGKRGSGKSYTIGVLAEELSSLPEEERQNIACLIFDTMGIFWTMKFKNEKELSLLEEWQLKPRAVPVEIFVPFQYFARMKEQGLPVDRQFAIKPSELNAEDWLITFGLEMTKPAAVLIQRVIARLKRQGKEFNIQDMISEAQKDKQANNETKNLVTALFETAESWGLFALKPEQGTSMEELVEPGTTTILDLSMYASVASYNIRALVIGLVSRKLFNQRMQARKQEELQAVQHGIDYLAFRQEREMPLVWIFIDEAHEFLPCDEKTPATDALVQLLREGRQPGISLVLATQQPGKIHTDVMTQADIVISHRVTSQPDIEALNKIMQTYLLESIKRYLDELPSLKGSAIVLDDNSERIYPIRVRPRFTWHGGEAPTAVRVEKRI